MPESRYFLRSAFMADVPAEVDGKRLVLFVYDLSIDGCMVETSDLEVVRGRHLELHFDKHRVTHGDVLWRKNRNLGVKFTTRLKPKTVERLTKAAADSPYKTPPWEKLDRSVLKVASRKVDPPRVRRRSTIERSTNLGL